MQFSIYCEWCLHTMKLTLEDETTEDEPVMCPMCGSTDIECEEDEDI